MRMKNILSNEFLNKYREEEIPLSAIGEFVYLRTYSRYLEDKKRRETWYETVLRTTEYNIGLGIDYKIKHGLPIDMEKESKEAELLFDNLFRLRTFTSGRTLYMGGTEIVKEYPLSNYNCCFTMIESMHDFVAVFYLLMLGCGVGIRIDKEAVQNLPEIKKTELEGLYDPYVRKFTSKEEMEHTILQPDVKDESVIIMKVGDSKEGWCEALEYYFKLVTGEIYDNISKIIINNRPRELLFLFPPTCKSPLTPTHPPAPVELDEPLIL
jgi:hypothetical protein